MAYFLLEFFRPGASASDMRCSVAAINYAISLHDLRRFHEAKAILRKTIPVVRRVLGDSHEITFQVRWIYAWALYKDSGATLDNVREAVTTLGESEPIARRVLGGAHPTTAGIEHNLQDARAALRAREGDVESIREVMEAMAPGDA